MCNQRFSNNNFFSLVYFDRGFFLRKIKTTWRQLFDHMQQHIEDLIFSIRRLVLQCILSATDTLGYWDVSGLSATDPRPRLPHYAQRCWHAINTSVLNCPPHVCV